MLKTTLIVLLVLGVLTVGAVAWAKHNGYCSIENRMQHISERIAHRLDLNDDQRVRLDDLVGTLRELRHEQRDSRQAMKDTVAEMLSAASLDRDRALALADQRLQGLSDSARTLVDAFADFSDSLTPEQRSRLTRLIEERWMAHAGHHRWAY